MKPSHSAFWHERPAMMWILFGLFALQLPASHGLKRNIGRPARMISNLRFNASIPLGASMLESSHRNMWPPLIWKTAQQLGIHLDHSLFLQSRIRSSPAFDQVLPMIDAKNTVLTQEVCKQGECVKVVEGLVNTTVPARGATQSIHTGLFLKSWKNPSMVKLAVRKLRLVMLSFLTTQDLKSTQLHVWMDVNVTDPNGIIQQELKEILVTPGLSNSTVLHRFDAGAEFSKVSPNSAYLLTSIFDQDGAVQAKSDLQRVIVLYNYGGIWLDTDVILIQDLTPLKGVDWAYVGQKNFINNAALSVSAPHSVFATSYLMALVSQFVTPELNDTSYFKHGATILLDLYKQEWTRNSFHILPTCFFDGYWSGEQNSPPWGSFFSGDIDGQQLSYIMPRNQIHTAFAYHWHGRWNVPMSNRSLAYGLERIYSWMLKLNASKDQLAVDRY